MQHETDSLSFFISNRDVCIHYVLSIHDKSFNLIKRMINRGYENITVNDEKKIAVT
jgi:hypothetical protein